MTNDAVRKVDELASAIPDDDEVPHSVRARVIGDLLEEACDACARVQVIWGDDEGRVLVLIEDPNFLELRLYGDGEDPSSIMLSLHGTCLDVLGGIVDRARARESAAKK